MVVGPVQYRFPKPYGLKHVCNRKKMIHILQIKRVCVIWSMNLIIEQLLLGFVLPIRWLSFLRSTIFSSTFGLGKYYTSSYWPQKQQIVFVFLWGRGGGVTFLFHECLSHSPFKFMILIGSRIPVCLIGN